MAELLGLSIGIVALIGTFNDCIDLISHISVARSLERDYAILDTKLDLEKTLLLHWAERVQLLNGGNHDPRLDHEGTHYAVSRVLESLKGLLIEGYDLQDRYGGSPAVEQERNTFAIAISGERLIKFKTSLSALKLTEVGSKDSKSISTLRRVRWTIHDKKKFETLVSHVSYFISKLNELIPDVGESMRALIQGDLANRSLAKLRLVVEVSSQKDGLIADAASIQITKTYKEKILQRIWFRRMDDRREDVASPHYKTLRWALETRTNFEAEWDDLSEWLSSGAGIYWISGKPGSGKTTLMKFLYDEDKTKGLLEMWSDKFSLHMGSFFLWSLGTNEQKSQEGLARAILFQIIDSDPELIPTLLSKMWQEVQGPEDIDLAIPTTTEIKTAFDKLADLQVNNQWKRKFCFFVDGLDECSGHYSDGVLFLHHLIQNTQIKIIVSSRPVSPYVNAFSKWPKLQMHDLTRGDIRQYVTDTVDSHDYMETLVKMDPNKAYRISSDLIQKASGVFLWVVLACRAVLEGFAACDDISDLRKRVDELPQELESLFQYLLQQIEPRYHGQVTKLLRILYQNQKITSPLPVQTIGWAMVEIAGNINEVENSAQLSDDEKRANCRLFEGRLRSRSCGLVEVKLARRQHQGHCFCKGHRGCHDKLIDSSVRLMHRTVLEFLENPAVWKLDCLKVEPSFEPSGVLVFMSLYLAHMSPAPLLQFERIIRDCILQARHADNISSKSFSPVYFQLAAMIESCIIRYHACYSSFLGSFPDHGGKGAQTNEIALYLAVEAGLVNFVQSNYNKSRGVFALHEPRLPLLYHALLQPHLRSLECLKDCEIQPSREMIAYLLSLGCNVNQIFLGASGHHTTPWECWVKDVRAFDLTSAMLKLDVTELLVVAGATLRHRSEDAEMGIEQRIRNLLGKLDRFIDDVRHKDVAVIKSRGLRLLTLIDEKAYQEQLMRAFGSS